MTVVPPGTVVTGNDRGVVENVARAGGVSRADKPSPLEGEGGGRRPPGEGTKQYESRKLSPYPPCCARLPSPSRGEGGVGRLRSRPGRMVTDACRLGGRLSGPRPGRVRPMASHAPCGPPPCHPPRR